MDSSVYEAAEPGGARHRYNCSGGGIEVGESVVVAETLFNRYAYMHPAHGRGDDVARRLLNAIDPEEDRRRTSGANMHSAALNAHPCGSRAPVSYTHLTLPTTPYV